MNKNKIFGILFIIFGVLLILTPGTLAPVCPAMPDGKFMKCHWMGQAIKRYWWRYDRPRTYLYSY